MTRTSITKTRLLTLKAVYTRTMGTSLDRDQWEEHLSYKFCGSTGEFGGDSDFTFMCNTKQFTVTVSPSCSNNQAGILVSRYNDAVEADDDEEIENIHQDIDDIILTLAGRYLLSWHQAPKSKLRNSRRICSWTYIQKHTISALLWLEKPQR
jgi:hypothetical protein